jgi:GDP-L-fucose synthase
MDKDATIYIAGHRGLVGSAIYRQLESAGYTNLVGRSSQELDLTDAAAVEAFFTEVKPEYVFLAAAKVGGIMANNIYRADFLYQNLAIQNNVIWSSYKHGVKKLLFLGSSCIYPKNAPQPITEDSLLSGDLEYTNEPYAIAKIAGIKLIESLNIQYGINYLAIQPTNLYGVNDNFDLEKSHVMPALIRKMFLCTFLEAGDFASIAKNLGQGGQSNDELLAQLEKYGIVKDGDRVTLKVWGTGTPRREFLHVDDMAAASVFVINNVDFAQLSQGMKEIKNTQINVGTGSDITINELANMIKDLVGFKGDIAFDSTKPDGTMRKLLSVDRLHKLGWQHTIDLSEGLQRTVDWYKENWANA